jgi:L-methionine (R)-S-oxide reductase
VEPLSGLSAVCGDSLTAVDETVLNTMRTAAGNHASRAKRAEAAAAAIRSATGARWVGLYTVADGVVTNEAWNGPAPPAHPTFQADQGLTAHAIAAHAVALSNDVAHDPRYLANQRDTGSEVIVPIILDGQVVGTLDVEDDRTGAFDGASVATYEAIANAILPLWQ